MARLLGQGHQSESVSYDFFNSMRCADCARTSYKIANEARPTQELKNIEKTITVEEQEFIKTADMDSLTRLLSDRLNEAEGRQEKHAHNQHSIGKIGKAAVAFANHFSSFLQAYSGIIEIMEGADQQYGGVAYSALSLLLIVGVFSENEGPLADVRT